MGLDRRAAGCQRAGQGRQHQLGKDFGIAHVPVGVDHPGSIDALRHGLAVDEGEAGVAPLRDLGVDVVGGIPHFERTMSDGAASVRTLCELAAERGLRVDMHCDESDDPLSRHVETLAFHTQRLGLHGRVTGSHLTSMHSMDNYYVSKLIPLMAEAGVHAVANPLINITLQGRHDSYPKRRGMTRVPELMAAGINVAFGHDCVMDPWYSLGSGDMLEVAHMGLHVAQMTSQAAMRQCFEAVTTNPARTPSDTKLTPSTITTASTKARRRLPLALRSIAFSIASASKPLWAQNLASSPAMTAATMLRSIRLSGVQLLSKPLGSMIIVSVIGGGTKR